MTSRVLAGRDLLGVLRDTAFAGRNRRRAGVAGVRRRRNRRPGIGVGGSAARVPLGQGGHGVCFGGRARWKADGVARLGWERGGGKTTEGAAGRVARAAWCDVWLLSGRGRHRSGSVGGRHWNGSVGGNAHADFGSSDQVVAVLLRLDVRVPVVERILGNAVSEGNIPTRFAESDEPPTVAVARHIGLVVSNGRAWAVWPSTCGWGFGVCDAVPGVLLCGN